MPAPKKRLDVLLVERGLFPTRAKAQAALMAGKVRVPGKDRPKPGDTVEIDCALEVLADACPYVSRGGLKLAAALDAFGVSPKGRVCLDVGASTGGFTDCLLKRGAAKVYAVDVGRAQLDAGLKADPRVVSMEGTHARHLKASLFDPSPDLATADVSFISLAKVLPYVFPCMKAPYDLVVLIKPQFELEPKKVPKGVVKDAGHRLQAVDSLREAARAWPVRDLGFIESPAKGAKGNVEFLWRLAS